MSTEQIRFIVTFFSILFVLLIISRLIFVFKTALKSTILCHFPIHKAMVNFCVTYLLIFMMIAIPVSESNGRYSNRIVVFINFAFMRFKTEKETENEILRKIWTTKKLDSLLSIVCANFSSPSIAVAAAATSCSFSKHSCANCIELLMELHIDSSIVVP